MSPAVSQPDEPIRAAVEQFLLRRLHGDPVTESQFVAEFPELGESLLVHLQQAIRIAEARDHSTDGRLESSSFDSGSSIGQLAIRCPYCQTMVSSPADTVWAEVECTGCHQKFSLIGRNEPDAPAISQLAHFDLIQRVGLGSFGTVWRAKDRQLDRIVALKIPRKGQLSEREAAMFMREAQATAQILHPHVVRLYEVGRHEETLFIACEYIDGETLAAHINDERLSHRDAAKLVEKIARALQAAHEAGVVHRDLTPRNILMDKQGEPHVTDFGLAKRDTPDVTMTIDGALVGTPAYMAPEQAAGSADQADARSDIYSLGVILFQLLTGELPFRGSAATMLKQVVHEAPPSPRKLNHYISRDLETICLKCLEKPPSLRFQTAEDLADELQRFNRREPIRTRPVGYLGRMLRWTQRRPLLAVLTTALLISLLLGSTVSLMFALHARDRSEQLAARSQDLAKKNEQLKASAYAYDMTEVQRLVQERNNEPALKLLEKFAEGTEEAHRRGPEWYHWWKRIHERQLAILQTDSALRGLAIHPVDSRIVWGNERGELWVADENLQNAKCMSSAHAMRVQQLSFSPDGKTLYSHARDGFVHVIDFAEDRIVKSIHSPGDAWGTMDLSADGKRLAVAAVPEKGTIEIDVWSTESWDSPRRLKVPGVRLHSMVWADDTAVLLGCETGRYRVSWRDDLSTDVETVEAEDSIPSKVKLNYPPRGCTSRVLTDGTFVSGNLVEGCCLCLVNASDEINVIDDGFRDGYAAEMVVDAKDKVLAIPTGYKRIHIYDLETRAKRLVLAAHRSRVTNARFVRDGKALVSTGEDGTIRLWDIQPTPERPAIRTKSFKSVLSGNFHGRVTLAANANRTAVSVDHHIHILTVPELTTVSSFDVPALFHMRGLTMSVDGTKVACIFDPADDHWPPRVAVWSSDDGAVKLIEKSENSQYSAAFSTDGSKLIVGTMSPKHDFPGDPAPLVVYETGSGSLVDRWLPSDDEDPWLPHRMRIAGIGVARNGSRVYTVGSRDRALKAWSYPDGKLLYTFRRPNNYFGASCIAVSSDSQTVAVAWNDHLISLHAANDGTLLATLMGHRDVINSVAFSPDSRTLVSGSTDSRIKVWDVKLGQLRTTLSGHDAPIRYVGISSDGEFIVSSNSDGELRVWDCSQISVTP